jgi:hypothetical protein
MDSPALFVKKIISNSSYIPVGRGEMVVKCGIQTPQHFSLRIKAGFLETYVAKASIERAVKNCDYMRRE